MILLHLKMMGEVAYGYDSDWRRQKYTKAYRCGILNKIGDHITLTEKGMKIAQKAIDWKDNYRDHSGQLWDPLSSDHKENLKKIMANGITNTGCTYMTGNALNHYENYLESNKNEYALGHMMYHTAFGFKDGVLTVGPEVEAFKVKQYKRESSLGKRVLSLQWSLTDMHWDHHKQTLEYCIYKADNKRSKRGKPFELTFRGNKMFANFADATYALKHHKTQFLDVIKRATPPEIQIAFADAVLGDMSSVRDLV